MSKVFIFGTGRCGSTYFQRLITLNTTTWVWGEHGGFLEPALAIAKSVRESKDIQDYIVSNYEDFNDVELLKQMKLDGKYLSWLNRFHPGNVDEGLRSLMDQCFGYVPNGWTDWGFKEIRYGFNNATPQHLAKLYPASKLIFTFRSPKKTIRSMLLNWTQAAKKQGTAPENFHQIFQPHFKLWKEILEYFVAARASSAFDVAFLTVENKPDFDLMFNWLSLKPHAQPLGFDIPKTNQGKDNVPIWFDDSFERLYAPRKAELEDIYGSAMEFAADFFPKQAVPDEREQSPESKIV